MDLAEEEMRVSKLSDDEHAHTKQNDTSDFCTIIGTPHEEEKLHYIRYVITLLEAMKRKRAHR